MKTRLSILIVLVLMVNSLCACSNSGSQSADTLNSEESMTDPAEQVTEESITEESMSDSAKEVYQYFSSVINPEDYEMSYGNNNITMTLKDDSKKEYQYSTDFILDGKKITLPCLYDDLVDAGWKFAYDFGEQTIDGNKENQIAHMDAVVANADNKEIWVTMTNPGAEALSITKCTCNGVTIPTATKKQVKNEKMPDFEVSSIRFDMKLKEAIDNLGNPSELSYIEESKMIQANFNKTNGSNEHLYITYYWQGSDDRMIMRDISLFISDQ